jgi:hypothetical protein
MNLAKWLYRGGHPNWLASVANRSAAVHMLAIALNYLVALEVRGRRSGRTVSLPLVMAVVDGERYLVSMLRADASWARNAKAAGGQVTLRHGRREQARLEEVPAERRAPILKAYLKRAPGARPHIAVDKDARFPNSSAWPRNIPHSGLCRSTQPFDAGPKGPRNHDNARPFHPKAYFARLPPVDFPRNGTLQAGTSQAQPGERSSYHGPPHPLFR